MMAPCKRQLKATRHLICGSCSNWVDFVKSGCEKSWAEVQADSFSFECRGCTKMKELEVVFFSKFTPPLPFLRSIRLPFVLAVRNATRAIRTCVENKLLSSIVQCYIHGQGVVRRYYSCQSRSGATSAKE